MELFSYSFAVTMMHSIWQAALLYAVYRIITGIVPTLHPVARRNVLFIILLTQVCISSVTFTLYYNDFFGSDGTALTAMLIRQDWLHSYSAVIFNCYAAAVFFQLFRVSLNWFRFKKKYYHALLKPPVELKVFMNVHANHFGIKRNVTLWLSNHITSPLTFGFFKPVILMPVALINRLSINETESLIIHELTHIRNNDFILNLLLVITESFYFFNPFVKIISRDIRLEREKNCDIKVLDFNYSGLHYAQTLLKIARINGRLKSLQLSAVQHKPQLIDRIRFFSQENLEFSKNKSWISYTGLVLAICFNLGVLLMANNKSVQPATLATMSVSGKELFKTIPATRLIPTVMDRKADPSIKKAGAPAEFYEYEETSDNTVSYAFAASMPEPEALPVKELIVDEEDSTGKVTSAYRVELINGDWIIQPMWKLSELKTKVDSLRSKTDSLVKFFNTIQ